MKQKILVTSVIVAAALVFVSFIAYLGEYSSHKRTVAEMTQTANKLKGKKEALDKTQTALKEAQKTIADLKDQITQMTKANAEEETKAKAQEDELKLAIAKETEGIEHPIGRQMQDKKEAHRIAIRGGYVDYKTGKEVRIKGKGGDVAFPLLKNERKVTGVMELKKNKDGNFRPVIIRKLAPDFKSSNFLGDIKGKDGIQSYEYIHTPK